MIFRVKPGVLNFVQQPWMEVRDCLRAVPCYLKPYMKYLKVRAVSSRSLPEQPLVPAPRPPKVAGLEIDLPVLIGFSPRRSVLAPLGHLENFWSPPQHVGTHKIFVAVVSVYNTAGLNLNSTMSPANTLK